jgi:hypothetical protein
MVGSGCNPVQQRSDAWFKPSLIGALVIIAVIAIVVAMLMPARSRIPREYFEGRDQFEWAEILEAGDPGERSKAIVALCELMKRTPPKSSVRPVAVHALVNANARQAIPALREMLQGEDEDLRNHAKRALQQIDPGK